jgi:hypothetical protein
LDNAGETLATSKANLKREGAIFEESVSKRGVRARRFLLL